MHFEKQNNVFFFFENFDHYSSKGVDASLLPTLSFPAFASHEERLVDLSKSNVVTRLRGKKGFKRFSRDGYMSRLEDRSRQYGIYLLFFLMELII